MLFSKITITVVNKRPDKRKLFIDAVSFTVVKAYLHPLNLKTAHTQLRLSRVWFVMFNK